MLRFGRLGLGLTSGIALGVFYLKTPIATPRPRVLGKLCKNVIFALARKHIIILIIPESTALLCRFFSWIISILELHIDE